MNTTYTSTTMHLYSSYTQHCNFANVHLFTLADATYCSTVYSQQADSLRVSAINTTP